MNPRMTFYEVNRDGVERYGDDLRYPARHMLTGCLSARLTN